MDIKIAESDSEILNCFDVMVELRTHLVKSEFVSIVRMQQDEGFNIAYISDNNEVKAVAGFRVSSNLCFGKNLYIDDLVTTLSDRSCNYGAKLIEWLRIYSVDIGCKVLHLDSGTQRDRAHKFYFANGFSISDYHFYMQLN